MFYTLIDLRNGIKRCSKVRWKHTLSASGFTAKFWTFSVISLKVYKSVDHGKMTEVDLFL